MLWTADRVELWGLERAITVTQQYGDGPAIRVFDREVELAVAIKIAG